MDQIWPPPWTFHLGIGHNIYKYSRVQNVFFIPLGSPCPLLAHRTRGFFTLFADFSSSRVRQGRMRSRKGSMLRFSQRKRPRPSNRPKAIIHSQTTNNSTRTHKVLIPLKKTSTPSSFGTKYYYIQGYITNTSRLTRGEIRREDLQG